jgi:hypothetical protein
MADKINEKHLEKGFILNGSQLDCPRFESGLHTYEPVIAIFRYGNAFLHMYPRSAFLYLMTFARIFRTIHSAERSGRPDAQEVSTGSNIGIVGSNPASGTNICFHSVFVLFCSVCGLAIG